MRDCELITNLPGNFYFLRENVFDDGSWTLLRLEWRSYWGQAPQPAPPPSKLFLLFKHFLSFMIWVIWTFNFFTISIRTKSLWCLFEFNLPILVLTSLDLIELFYIILQNFISNFKISGLQKLLCVYEVLWENDQVKCLIKSDPPSNQAL